MDINFLEVTKRMRPKAKAKFEKNFLQAISPKEIKKLALRIIFG